MKLLRTILFTCTPLLAQVEVIRVTSRALDRIVKLPGEIQAYESVLLHARTAGYVEQVLVDRGSAVKRGQLLVKLSAPEMAAQVAEAASKTQAAEAQRAEAEAHLASAQSTYDKLKAASATPGAIAGNELVQAEKSVDAAKALVHSREGALQAARSSEQASKALEAYLNVTAPFTGMVTQRLVHPGALAGPAEPLLEVQQVSRLRVVVAVPEENVEGIARGRRVEFTVPAAPGQRFSGVVARISHALDPKTRTMPVELDVQNTRGMLAPGMYPEVLWPVHSAGAALLVPATSVVTTTEKTFVIRVTNGRAEWVSVKKGAADGDLVQVAGPLKPGDVVVRRGTDEIREGSPIKTQVPAR